MLGPFMNILGGMGSLHGFSEPPFQPSNDHLNTQRLVGGLDLKRFIRA